jgi:hypothetical protein
MLELSGVMIVGLVLCGVVLLFVVGAGLITFLIKIGVIVREAQRPPHVDAGDYRLDQGHEVRGEDQQR